MYGDDGNDMLRLLKGQFDRNSLNN